MGRRGCGALAAPLPSAGPDQRLSACTAAVGLWSTARCLQRCDIHHARADAPLTSIQETSQHLPSMWGLDRLSAHSTPSGTPPPRRDSHSPAPRRPYPQGPMPLPPRPGINPRSSSLSLVSPASSVTSLPAGARLPNGAGRRRPPGGAPPNVPDPVQVLEQIMGGPPRKPVTSKGDRFGAIPSKPDELEVDIEFGELSLQAFVVQAAADTRQSSTVHTYSAQSVEECMCLPPTFCRFAHGDCSRQREGQV